MGELEKIMLLLLSPFSRAIVQNDVTPGSLTIRLKIGVKERIDGLGTWHGGAEKQRYTKHRRDVDE